MRSRHQLQTAFLITRKKAASGKALAFSFLGLACLPAIFWIEDSFSLSLRAYLFFSPYIFLFLAQDIYRDEIDSGALESVVFLRDGFRDYLLAKNLVLAGIGFALSLVGFTAYAVCGLALGRLSPSDLSRFLIGLVVGLYYLAAGGGLSFFLKSGSNALVVIVGQACLGVGLVFSLAGRHGWVENLLGGSFPNAIARLRFLAFSLFFPNVVIVRRLPLGILGIGLATLCLLWFAGRRIRSLELFRR